MDVVEDVAVAQLDTIETGNEDAETEETASAQTEDVTAPLPNTSAIGPSVDLAPVTLSSLVQSWASELQEFVKSRLAPFKYPRLIEFIDALPKTATGKIQRFRLRQS